MTKTLTLAAAAIGLLGFAAPHAKADVLFTNHTGHPVVFLLGGSQFPNWQRVTIPAGYSDRVHFNYGATRARLVVRTRYPNGVDTITYRVNDGATVDVRYNSLGAVAMFPSV